ncbi:MAG: response regulator [Alphaproteobacteria bacterium]
MMKRVLIVEDDELSMKLFCDLIRVRGHLVLKAVNGAEALRLAREQRPDLILMDMQLPDVSGLHVTRMIKNDENLKSTPVIAITSYVTEQDQETIRNGGCDDYIAKPISLSGFGHVMEKFLG